MGFPFALRDILSVLAKLALGHLFLPQVSMRIFAVFTNVSICHAADRPSYGTRTPLGDELELLNLKDTHILSAVRYSI